MEKLKKLLFWQRVVFVGLSNAHVVQFEAQISLCRSWPTFTEGAEAAICSSHWSVFRPPDDTGDIQNSCVQNNDTVKSYHLTVSIYKPFIFNALSKDIVYSL